MSNRQSEEVGIAGVRGAAIMVLAIAMLITGCADDDMAPDGDWDDYQGSGNAQAGESMDGVQSAEQALMAHRVDEARDIYAEMVNQGGAIGEAQAGLGVTESLLIAGRPTLSDMLMDHFEARRELEANELLYAEGGYLYWASRGVQWEDDAAMSDVRGIRSLIADRLPWREERLESLANFSEGLDSPANDWMRELVTLANGLGDIDEALEGAVETTSFSRFYVPGQVLHHSDLALRLGRAEISLLRAAVQGLRGMIYFVSAYDHGWTMEDVFGDWRYSVEIDDGRWQAGFEPLDYALAELGQELFVQVDNEERLSAARRAFEEGLEHLRDALHYGGEQTYSTTGAWGDLDDRDRDELDALLVALQQSLKGPVELPHVEPQVTLNLKPLFDEGRQLPEGKGWWEPALELGELDDEVEPVLEERWQWSQSALDAFLEGVIDGQQRRSMEITAAGGVEEVTETLFGEWWSTLEEVYFATR